MDITGITGAQALRDLMEAGHLYSIMLVAPRIASAAFSVDLVGIDDLDKAAAIIKEQEKHYQDMQVKDGAWLVDRMILGKCWLLQNDSKARTNGARCYGTSSGAEAKWITQALSTL